VESFFATLKRELIHRRHSSLGYLSPEQFERRAAATSALPVAA
jgi:transposase InsO family protein